MAKTKRPEVPVYLREWDTVRVLPTLSKRDFAAPRINQVARCAGQAGHIVKIVNDMFFVRHQAEIPAVYYANELLPEPKAYWVVKHLDANLWYFKEFASRYLANRYIVDLPNGVDHTLEGPFFSDKVLEEGIQTTRNLFDHLLDDDV